MHKVTVTSHKMPARREIQEFVYLGEQLDAQWGLNLTTVGYQRARPHAQYPLAGHPKSYMFEWSKGRQLNEYQMIYLSGGSGEFACGSACRKVSAGDLLLLCSGDWHRYRPDADTGWESYWVGFKGPYIEEYVHRRLFEAHKSHVRAIGFQQDLVSLFEQLIALSRQRTPLLQILGLGCLLQIVAYAKATLRVTPSAQRDEDMADTVALVERNVVSGVDFKALARSLNLSYSRFRYLFKERTGMSPHQFVLNRRIEHAKALLRTSQLSIKSIAFQCGFQNQSYFSRLFRKKTGVPPSVGKARAN